MGAKQFVYSRVGRRPRGLVVVLLVVFLLLLIGGGVFYLRQQQVATQQEARRKKCDCSGLTGSDLILCEQECIMSTPKPTKPSPKPTSPPPKPKEEEGGKTKGCIPQAPVCYRCTGKGKGIEAIPYRLPDGRLCRYEVTGEVAGGACSHCVGGPEATVVPTPEGGKCPARDGYRVIKTGDKCVYVKEGEDRQTVQAGPGDSCDKPYDFDNDGKKETGNEFCARIGGSCRVINGQVTCVDCNGYPVRSGGACTAGRLGSFSWGVDCECYECVNEGGRYKWIVVDPKLCGGGCKGGPPTTPQGPTPTVTPTPTSPTPTASPTPTPTGPTPTATLTPTPTPTGPTPTATITATPSITPSVTTTVGPTLSVPSTGVLTDNPTLVVFGTFILLGTITFLDRYYNLFVPVLLKVRELALGDSANDD